MTRKELLAQFDSITLERVFEFPVTKNGEDDWVLFEVSATIKGLWARWEGKPVFVAWDTYSNLESHLQQLHSVCSDAISELDFVLRDDQD